MAQYISPFPGNKKTVIFEQREETLRHAIRHNFSDTKVRKAAENLRAAKMYLVKALLRATKTYRDEDKKPIERINNLEKERKEWQAFSVEEIVERYTQKPSKPE